MKKVIMLILTVLLFITCTGLTSQEFQARKTVKDKFKNSIEGDSYKPIAWGSVEYNSPYAGTGTRNLFSGITGEPYSLYSITHRLQMRNGFGMLVTFDVRIFFTDETCTKWAGMEYMARDDLERWSLR